jgi:hypothetical protein
MQQTAQTPRKKTLLAAAVGILATLVVLALTAIAPADSVKTIGGVRGKAPPSCPKTKGKPFKDCQTMAKVTAFQQVANGKKGPTKVRENGKIVAWSLDLSEPSREEKQILSEGFKLGEPTAKLAILKPQGKGKFKLTKQSPRIKIQPMLGTQPIFTLKKPIRVKKGTIVAITTSSWVPNLAHDGALTAKNDKWRASRESGKCGTTNDRDKNNRQILAGKPQRKVGSVVRYGCTYVVARLLYKAYYVPVKGKGGGGNGGK